VNLPATADREFVLIKIGVFKLVGSEQVEVDLGILAGVLFKDMAVTICFSLARFFRATFISWRRGIAWW
jgi:hypothetical protein